MGRPVVPDVAKITARSSFPAREGRPAIAVKGASRGERHQVRECSVRACSKSSISAPSTTAKGSTSSRIPMEVGTPAFVLMGTIAHPKEHTARESAKTIGEFGIITAKR